jgi:hypothetical protein
MTYKNRYDDVFTFTKDDNEDILWEGNFQYSRFGMPNDYTKAFNAFVADGGKFSFNEFKESVHDWDYEINDYSYPKYVRMVECLKDEVDMVDPSGGPYITSGMSLGSFGFKGYLVKGFKRINTGYKIVTEKCSGCHKPGAIHKMSCPTQKATVFIDNKEIELEDVFNNDKKENIKKFIDEVKSYYDQMDKEVHQNRSNLNK